MDNESEEKRPEGEALFRPLLIRGALWTLPLWSAPFLIVKFWAYHLEAATLNWLFLLMIFHCLVLFSLSLLISRPADFFSAILNGIKISVVSFLTAILFSFIQSQQPLSGITGGAPDTNGMFPFFFLIAAFGLVFSSVAGSLAGLLFRRVKIIS